jgi:hypothetical protein
MSILSTIFTTAILFLALLFAVVVVFVTLGNDGMPSPEEDQARQLCVDRIAELRAERDGLEYKIAAIECQLELADLGLPLNFQIGRAHV